MQQRRFVFLNHATPDDNAFTIWLGARLAGAGYHVWSDLLMLGGGERFWKDIDEAIRHYTALFVPILTPASVNLDREGVHNEISIATQVRKAEKIESFIIPVQAERCRGGNPELQQLNYISFTSGWAEGLRRLLKRLAKLGIPRREGLGAEEMQRWLRVQGALAGKILQEPSELESNWLPLLSLPPRVTMISTPAGREAWDAAVASSKIPMRPHLRLAVTFGTLDAVSDEFGIEVPVRASYQMLTDDFLFDRTAAGVPYIKGVDARRMAVDMLRRGWEVFAASRGLVAREMSGKTAWYFPAGLLLNDWAPFVDHRGQPRRRRMTGIRGARGGYAGISLSAKPQILPVRRLVLNAHVVFTEASGAPIVDVRTATRYRKALCRSWWNDAWRDRQRAALAFLAAGGDSFDLPLGGVFARIAAHGMTMRSPVSYERGSDLDANEADEEGPDNFDASLEDDEQDDAAGSDGVG